MDEITCGPLKENKRNKSESLVWSKRRKGKRGTEEGTENKNSF